MLCCDGLDKFRGFHWRISEVESFCVFRINSLCLNQSFFNQCAQWLPKIQTDQDNREIFHFLGLNECQNTKELVQSSKASRKSDETVRIFGKHVLSHHEVFKLH